MVAALPYVFHVIEMPGIAHNEPRRLDAVAVECIENLVRVARGAIVESEIDHALVGLDVV